MEFVHLKLKATGGITSVPDEPGVVERYEALGWSVYTPEESAPFHPTHAPAGEPVPEFVELANAETGARHQFPNNAEAIQGAAESGWVPVERLESEHTPKTPEPVPVSKTMKTKAKAADDSSETE